MKKFVFKFSTVLDLRKIKEKEALRLFAVAQKACQHEIERKGNLLGDLQNALLGRESLGADLVTISAYQSAQDYIVGTKQRIIQADQAIVRANRAVQKALRNYLLARKDSMAMETLYKQAQEEHRLTAQKREKKEMDDLTVMRSRLKEDFL